MRARKKRKVVKTKEKDAIGSPIYKIEGLKGDWVQRMVEVPTHKLSSYLADLESVHGREGVIQIDNKFFIKRTWGLHGQKYFIPPELEIPKGMVLQKQLTKTGGQTHFKSGNGKKKPKALNTKKTKRRVKKGSDNLMTFGIRMPNIKTLEEW